jgi:hypothetical protein
MYDLLFLLLAEFGLSKSKTVPLDEEFKHSGHGLEPGKSFLISVPLPPKRP